jgi:hypothetical protein
LDDLDAQVEINCTWETIRENISISAKESLGYSELKKHKTWIDDGYSTLLDQRKQAKLHGDNLNNVKRAASRHFRNKKRKYLKDKVNELATNIMNKNKRPV